MSLDALAKAPRPGSLLARKYRVERTLGAGGMGVVVAATHIQLQEPVAIKLLHPEVASRKGAIERFLREARVAMKLRGEHVVRIHDVGTLDGGAPFIVMEYLKGNDLGRLLQQRGRFEVEEAVEALLQACEAIAEAHALGVVHRDLKPANLFMTTSVDGSPSIKVLDFGVSKVLSDLTSSGDVFGTTAPSSDAAIAVAPPSSADAKLALADTCHAAESSHATRTRAVLGSPQYMAPEQIRSARDVDARADVWSLGIILYELVTGERPFDADTLDRLKQAILAEPPRPLPSLPPGIGAAIQTCLAKDPAERYQDVLELAEALAPFGGEGAGASVTRICRILKRTSSASIRRDSPVPTQAPPTGVTADEGVMHDGEKKPTSPPLRRLVSWGVVALLFVGLALARRPWASGDARVQASPSSASAAVVPAETTIASEPPAPPAPPPVVSRAAPVPPPRTRPHPRAAPAPSASAAAPSIVDPLGVDGGVLFNEPH